MCFHLTENDVPLESFDVEALTVDPDTARRATPQSARPAARRQRQSALDSAPLGSPTPAPADVSSSPIEDTSISVIDAAACNAIVRRGCRRTPPKIAVDRAPSVVGIAAGTIYTANNGDNTVSVVPITR